MNWGQGPSLERTSCVPQTNLNVGTAHSLQVREIGDATSWEKTRTGGDREYHVNNLILHLIISTYINY